MSVAQEDPWLSFNSAQIKNIKKAETAAKNELAGFSRWMLIGSALHDLQQAAMKQAQSDIPKGKAYNNSWVSFASKVPSLMSIPHSERSDAIWLHKNQDLANSWWTEQPTNVRNRLRTPRVLKRRIERDLGLEIDPEQELGPKKTTNKDVLQAVKVVDKKIERLADGQDLSGTKHYDLSTPDMVKESAFNFIQVYGPQQSLQFVTELMALINPKPSLKAV